jgi:hypothetical protein
MKYRILDISGINSKAEEWHSYKVQYKWGLFWRTCQIRGYDDYDAEFDTLEKALEFLAITKKRNAYGHKIKVIETI